MIFLTQAENELRLTQTEFDRQQEITRLLLEGTVCVQVALTKDMQVFVLQTALFLIYDLTGHRREAYGAMSLNSLF